MSQQEIRNDITQEEMPRPEIREGEGEPHIVGQKSIAIRAEDDEVHTQDLTDDVKIAEQETRADVTQEETKRQEIKDGEREIYVQETAISKAIGADNRLIDKQGKKRFVIRKTNTKNAVQTQGTDGKSSGNELKELKEEATEKVNEETPFMSQKEKDEPNE
ncbi:hypothetical protein QQF64_034575 [Cirrhinus molitorella]|uniref:Uncharacterized protein n=1 Tax=Cirrhinus molitorella TaxID=172907 RepID=A0ABR3L0Y6_9TELE